MFLSFLGWPERLLDKVTYGQGSEESQREFADIKPKNLP